MIRRRSLSACLALLATAPLVASCGLYTRPTSEDREARQDCDAEADRIFAARNRYQLSERSSADTPYAGNSLPANPTAGLSDQYEQDNLVDDCLRRSGASAEAGGARPSGAAVATSATPPSAPRGATP